MKEGEIYLQRLKNDVLRTVHDFFIQQPQDIVAYVGGDRFVILKTINSQDKAETIRVKLIKTSSKIKDAISIQRKFQSSIGIGEYHPGIRGFDSSLMRLLIEKVILRDNTAYLSQPVRLCRRNSWREKQCFYCREDACMVPCIRYFNLIIT